MRCGRALVTGGAGFIGSHVAEALLARGIETVVLDDLSVGTRENVPPGAEFVRGDIRDEPLLQETLRGVDAVFHLAARVSIRDSFRGLREDAETNVMGTIAVLNSLRGTDVKKLILASSMAVYGNAVNLPINESHRCEPLSPYGIGKLACEQYAACVCGQLGIRSIALRYFNTYGPRQTPSPYVGVITIFLRKLLGGEALPVFGDGRQVRDFVSVSDVAEATCLALDYDGPAPVFNVGSGVGTDVNTVAALLKSKVNPHARVEHLPQQAGEPADSIADISLARRELGFSPRWSLEEKLPEIIAWNAGKAR